LMILHFFEQPEDELPIADDIDTWTASKDLDHMLPENIVSCIDDWLGIVIIMVTLNIGGLLLS
jgi:hypothetical protein